MTTDREGDELYQHLQDVEVLITTPFWHHPWRTMPNHAMTPHTAGTPLDAQQTYADGVRRCLQAIFEGEPIEDIRMIVQGGEIVSGTYSAMEQAE